VVSPHTDQVVATVPEGTAADMDAAVAAARLAFDDGPWPRLSPAERIAVAEAFSGEVARGVRADTYGVNTYTMDFAAPFGGYQASGVGREFGPEGLGQYTELKSIYTRPQ
jgi:acyl-CoA reductase-like NAD-dependent aldehyde dehydrogenase